MPTPVEAKDRLDRIIRIARVDLYKPIQIAEVLRRSRLTDDIELGDIETYNNKSLRWRDEVTLRLLGKVSTSSARYQHDVWNATAMPPAFLAVLDEENKRTLGGVERYIYLRFNERQQTVANIIALIESATPNDFDLAALLGQFVAKPGIRRSIDKAYELTAYALFETIVVALGTTVRVEVPHQNNDLLVEFSDLTRVLIGIDAQHQSWELPAHIYRVGVTNAADRGLDMWANFGPAIQVKHLTLDDNMANIIVDQVESDNIVIVCRDADAQVIATVTKQIGWGRRVRGVVLESELVAWYDRCLRGRFAPKLAGPLLQRLANGFKAEFPQARTVADFLEERGYLTTAPDPMWLTEIDIVK